jgi:hypothetical protein
VEDAWFKSYQAFISVETRFKVVSVLKGDSPGVDLRFRHYDKDPAPQPYMFQPQFYSFEVGGTYLVFAKKGDQPGVFRQLWMYHTGKMDQGVLRCSDDKPVTAKTVKECLWNELVLSLKSPEPGRVCYALQQLDQMSGGSWYGHSFDTTQDFDRVMVLAAIREPLTHGDPKAVREAILVAGSHNPYMDVDRAEFWLGTVGTPNPGLSQMDPKMKNSGGETFARELQDIANGGAPADTRALAIRALGLVRKPELRDNLDRWVADPEPAVRAATAVLLADYPGTKTNGQLTALDADPSPLVRVAVAHAIGFSQQSKLAQILSGLLGDGDSKVRRAACMSLLSMPMKQAAVARAYRDQLENKEFAPLFLNALASQNPELYLDSLAQEVESKTEPSNWSGGEIPAFTSWKILFKYLQGQPLDVLKSGKVDRYLDALEKVGNYSSSEPRDIYAFYLLSNLPERAKAFRTKATKAATYDLDYYFKQVDERPENYRRQ